MKFSKIYGISSRILRSLLIINIFKNVKFCNPSRDLIGFRLKTNHSKLGKSSALQGNSSKSLFEANIFLTFYLCNLLPDIRILSQSLLLNLLALLSLVFICRTTVSLYFLQFCLAILGKINSFIAQLSSNFKMHSCSWICISIFLFRNYLKK